MTEETEIGNFLELGWFKVILAIGENVSKVNVTLFKLFIISQERFGPLRFAY